MEKEVTRSSIVNSSLDTLKSSFLDVYYYHTGALAYLREQVDVLGVNNKEEALQDLEGIQTMSTLGKNMAYLLKCLEAGKEKGIEKPQLETKVKTNFIR